jgi:hypothetical protein
MYRNLIQKCFAGPWKHWRSPLTTNKLKFMKEESVQTYENFCRFSYVYSWKGYHEFSPVILTKITSTQCITFIYYSMYSIIEQQHYSTVQGWEMSAKFLVRKIVLNRVKARWN